jgi:myo-inositol-1(or 4)-monophosphatase
MSFLSPLHEEFKELLPIVKTLRNTAILKSDDSPVTDADILLDKFITDKLKEFWPEITIISEEGLRNNQPSSNRVAIVDPLDGTENFVSGLPIWGISISIWNLGKHEMSGVFFPELDKKLVSGQNIEPFQSRIEGFSSSVTLIDLISQGRVAKESRVLGCASYNLFNTILGSFKSFRNDQGAHAWDILGGLNLALEHGCGVKVNGEIYRGEFLSPDKKHTFEVSR